MRANNPYAWVMALFMVGSAVARILIVGGKGTDLWSQIILPIAAAVLFVAIAFIGGKRHFYRTAVPVWMMMFYFFFVIKGSDFGRFDTMITVLYGVVFLAIAIVYTQITSDKTSNLWMLSVVLLIPVAALLFLYRHNLQNFGDIITGKLSLEFMNGYRAFSADLLMSLGLLFAVFSAEHRPVGGPYYPTWGDRVDGRRIRSEPPMNQLTPYIMVERSGCMNYLHTSVDITKAERYCRQKRREGLTNFGLMHVIMTAYCRGVAKYPAINRFISGQKLYSRGEDLVVSITVKKEMTVDAPETIIKFHLSPYDTAEDVYHKIQKEVDAVKDTPLDSDFDNLAHIFNMIPGVFLKFTIWLLKLLDYFGLLPKFLLEFSPFHGSIYFTSMGSLGIPPVYHHLYNFGNIPMFTSFGCKYRVNELQEDGTVVQKKFMDCNITVDDRVCDGFHYAAFFKNFQRVMANPEQLDLPPETVVQDVD
ncbi:MAG: 2-oxo acid dehydrogenase subunit E2 [Oscillospiraceae bacterium]|nr:2-oxo acid dehydrogenase subunit E2 [Oscillospiraceae bacterium]